MGPYLSPGATVREYPLGHQPETIFGLERAIPKVPILASKGPFLAPRDRFALGAKLTKKAHFAPKSEIFLFYAEPFGFQESLLSLRGSFGPSLEQVLDHPMRSYAVSQISMRI